MLLSKFLKQFLQFLSGNIHIFKNAFQNLRVQNFAAVKRNGNSFNLIIFGNLLWTIQRRAVSFEVRSGQSRDSLERLKDSASGRINEYDCHVDEFPDNPTYLKF